MWAKVRKGHRIEETTKQEGRGLRERLQSAGLVTVAAEPQLGGAGVVGRAEVSRDRRKSA